MTRTTHERRGMVGRLDLLALLVVGLVGLGMILPVTRKIGCSSDRLQSQQNLQAQHKIHALYATDWNQRQFTAVPDDFGLHGGDCAQWEAATGKEIPGLELGRSCGIATVGFYGCEWSAARNPIDFDMQMERLPNPKGDRVKITMSGKFLPYKYYGNSGNVPEYGYREE